jgi:hypothetical protein
VILELCATHLNHVSSLCYRRTMSERHTVLLRLSTRQAHTNKVIHSLSIHKPAIIPGFVGYLTRMVSKSFAEK